MKSMKSVDIYTDGACSGNPGPGGAGVVMKYGEMRKELNFGYRRTTNNRMELLAAIHALESLKEPCKVRLFSDSRYLVDAVTKGWIVKWQRDGWQRKNVGPVLNPDLWKRLIALLDVHALEFVWVKGHASNAENNRCDELARQAAANPGLDDSGYLG